MRPMRPFLISSLLLMLTFVGPTNAENEFEAAYRRGDYATMLRLLRPFVEQGAPEAQKALGDMYVSGQGVPKNEVEGAKWIRRAAEQGYANAQTALGALYGMGRGVPQDLTQSAIWYRRAAQQGHIPAQLKLGLMLYEGSGIPKDYVSAYMWFNLAAANSTGDSFDRKAAADAARVRDLIAGLMTPFEIAEGQKLARNWKPTALARTKSAAPPIATGPGEKTLSGNVSRGTGFFFSQDGHVLTNAHVVEDCWQATLRTADTTGQARILIRDAQNDLALLASDLRPTKIAGLRLSAKLGEEVVVYGYPLSGLLSSGGNVTAGNITALAGIGDDSRFFQISAPVQLGNSGGPVLDRQGNIMGIVVAKLDALKVAGAIQDIPQNVNFAIKSAVAANFLNAQAIGYSEGVASAPLSTADLALRAKAFTVQLECRH
jgi:uncharacterized protein